MNKKNGVITEKCCECGNCINSCPVKAIKMVRDDLGTGRAEVDGNICIGCGKCEELCPIYSIPIPNKNKETYAVVSKKKEAKYSSSGGVFLELAVEILNMGGRVVGAAYDKEWNVTQEMILNPEDIIRLQGSKYVKSNVGESFQLTKEALRQGRYVLYSGTPCQIAALFNFLGEKTKTEKLLTIDIVCHGTPPINLFKNYIAFLENKKKNKISEFSFRDKKYGHKLIGRYVAKKKYILYSSESSYYTMFLKGYLYNEACYSCPFAMKERMGDFTIGDFWGIKEEIPQFYKNNNLKETESVSAVMLNTDKAVSFFKKITPQIYAHKVEYEQVCKHNPQMNVPTVLNKEKYKKLSDLYKKDGYQGLERYFLKEIGFKRYILRITCYIPEIIKVIIKKS